MLKHEYIISNSSAKKNLFVKINLISELGLQSAVDSAGFQSVSIKPHNSKEIFLEGAALDHHTVLDPFKNTKTSFTYDLDISPTQNIGLVFISYGIFNLRDRFHWYSQDFCAGCIIETMHEEYPHKINYKIHHHEKERVKVDYNPNQNHDSILFNSSICPYEGVTMYWDFVGK